MESKIIRPGEGIVAANTPMIPFNCIFDIDYGLLKTINDSYLDPSVFDVEWFKEHHTIRSLVYELYNRDLPNPLSICTLDKENTDMQQDLLDTFLKEEYSTILSNAIPTELFHLLKSYKSVDGINPYILYESEEEEEYLDSITDFDGIQKISLAELLDEIGYIEQFFFKSIYKDIYFDTLADSIEAKSVYLANYKFNTDSHFVVLSDYLATVIAKKNKIRTIDIYNRMKLGGEIK